MIEINPSRFRTVPHAHQLVGVRSLVQWNDPAAGRVHGGCFFLGDEMGAGKTKQVIDAAQCLWEAGLIDQVLVICPSAVRSVWFEPELGELAKHAFVPITVTEFYARNRTWQNAEAGQKRLRWTITNYDWIRGQERFKTISADKRTVLVLDEASAVKNYKALQTKAAFEIRKRCGWVWLLNGTPIANNPGDLYSQFGVMNSKIIGCSSWFHFRARYAKLGGWKQKQIVGWHDLEDLQAKLKPYILRRLKTDCLDLPPQLPAVTLTVPLSAETWAVYREMRDEMIAWLDQQTVAMAPQAAVKAMRLAQVTSGFLGGIASTVSAEDRPAWVTNPTETRELSREKLDMFVSWWSSQLEEDPGFKVIVWCRFRAEVVRLLKEFEDRNASVGAIYGGQKPGEREYALRLLDPRVAPAGPVVVVGIQASGALGLNLTASHTMVYMSNDYNLKNWLQSRDRVHRPGQVHAVSYYDMLATGPHGQKTVDHAVLKALRQKHDVATWTCAAWREALLEE